MFFSVSLQRQSQCVYEVSLSNYNELKKKKNRVLLKYLGTHFLIKCIFPCVLSCAGVFVLAAVLLVCRTTQIPECVSGDRCSVNCSGKPCCVMGEFSPRVISIFSWWVPLRLLTPATCNDHMLPKVAVRWPK